MRSYFAAWGDREAYAVSHVGWGMNPRARWDAMAMYDKRDFNGTELRAFAGNFLYSTGANEVAGRHTLGHFDLPLRNCTVALDGTSSSRRACCAELRAHAACTASRKPTLVLLHGVGGEPQALPRWRARFSRARLAARSPGASRATTARR